MSSPDDAVPETLVPASAETGEITALPPEEARKVAEEIRAIAEQRGEDSEVFDLSELPQIETGRHVVDRETGKLVTIKDVEEDDALTAEELRDAWPLLDLEERSDGLRVMPREDAEEFFISLSAVDQSALLMHFRPGQRRQWMRLLEPDDVADVIQEVDEKHRSTLLGLLDVPTRKEVTALLAYAEDEAGGLMSTRYARLRPQMTADEAVAFLRRQAQAKLETIYTAYVVDNDNRLLGVVSFRDLFAADPGKTVAEIMETDVVRVSDETDQETVSRIFAEHDLNVIPVVDAEGKMQGIVTVDDIVDVVQEEATEDIQKFGGIAALDVPYLEVRRREMIRKRIPVLLGMCAASALTALALGSFDEQIAAVPFLAMFITMIVSSGGNTGTQATTLVVRAMALGEVRAADWWLIMRRELVTGLALGSMLGLMVTLGVFLYALIAGKGHEVRLALVIGLSVQTCVLFGTLTGSMLPFVLRKFGIDPASASAPAVTTIVDVTGILIYFAIANAILRGVLL